MDWKGPMWKWETSWRLQSHELEIMVTGTRVRREGGRRHSRWIAGMQRTGGGVASGMAPGFHVSSSWGAGGEYWKCTHLGRTGDAQEKLHGIDLNR